MDKYKNVRITNNLKTEKEKETELYEAKENQQN